MIDLIKNESDDKEIYLLSTEKTMNIQKSTIRYKDENNVASEY